MNPDSNLTDSNYPVTMAVVIPLRPELACDETAATMNLPPTVLARRASQSPHRRSAHAIENTAKCRP